MAVGITDDGQRRFHAHGVAGTGLAPVDEDTVFELGSITKLFTALLLADMAGHNQVALDDPVAALLPPGTAMPKRAEAITLRHLAMHTSGLPRVPADLPLDSPDPYANYGADRLYAALAGIRLTRWPGDAFEYSNLGAGLLGHALGLRAGQGYEALLAARILAPLGMASTAVRLPHALAARFASPHDDSGDPVPAWNLGVLSGASGLRSTARDMLLFLEALLHGDAGPLGPSAAVLATPAEAGGLGFGLQQPEGHITVQHEGGTGGTRSYAACIPAWRRGVVVLANAATGACADLGIHLGDARWGLHWFRTPVAVDPAALKRLPGQYRMRPGAVFDVTLRGDRLMVQLTGQPAFRVFPLSEWAFFCKVINAQITFEPGGDGRAAWLVLHQNSLDQIAERIGA